MLSNIRENLLGGQADDDYKVFEGGDGYSKSEVELTTKFAGYYLRFRDENPKYFYGSNVLIGLF